MTDTQGQILPPPARPTHTSPAHPHLPCPPTSAASCCMTWLLRCTICSACNRWHGACTSVAHSRSLCSRRRGFFLFLEKREKKKKRERALRPCQTTLWLWLLGCRPAFRPHPPPGLVSASACLLEVPLQQQDQLGLLLLSEGHGRQHRAPVGRIVPVDCRQSGRRQGGSVAGGRAAGRWASMRGHGGAQAVPIRPQKQSATSTRSDRSRHTIPAGDERE